MIAGIHHDRALRFAAGVGHELPAPAYIDLREIGGRKDDPIVLDHRTEIGAGILWPGAGCFTGVDSQAGEAQGSRTHQEIPTIDRHVSSITPDAALRPESWTAARGAAI